MATNMETTTPQMEDLAAAFAASVTMSGDNNSHDTPPRPAAIASTSTSSTSPEMEMVLHMEKLVAALAATSVAPQRAHPAAPSTTTTTPSSHTATTTTATKEEDDCEPAKGEEACVLRVRFPDGRVLCRSFGAGRPVTALFRYCRSVLLAAGNGEAGRRAFQIVRPAGGASDEVRAGSSTFRELGLHHCTVHVVLAR